MTTNASGTPARLYRRYANIRDMREFIDIVGRRFAMRELLRPYAIQQNASSDTFAFILNLFSRLREFDARCFAAIFTLSIISLRARATEHDNILMRIDSCRQGGNDDITFTGRHSGIYEDTPDIYL